MIPNKKEILRLLIETLTHELESVTRSARAAHEAATHEESRAEDAHDTRGLEASYLAGAQLARAENLKRLIAGCQFIEIREFKDRDAVGVGALVELRLEEKPILCFLVKEGGGTPVMLNGNRIQFVSPQSPLGEALLGSHVGDVIEVESMKSVLEYEVVAIH